MTALPDYLTDQTEEGILQRMLGRLPSDLDKAEGSFIWDSLAPSAYELFNFSLRAQEVLRRGFASTTFGVYLDYRCLEHGIERKKAELAAGLLKITGKPGTIVPSGVVVATQADAIANISSIEFTTDSEAQLDSGGEAVVAIKARVAGPEGNVLANSIVIMTSPVSGVQTITNEASTTGGTPEETDESLLARLLAKLRQPATSGNAAQYRQWALEVAGVGDARVFPLWNGPGTVKLVIADLEREPAGEDLIADVASHVEAVRPIGATVTVVSANAKNIAVQGKVTLAAGYTIQSVTDGFVKSVQDYLQDTAFKTSYVSYAKIGTLLLGVPGVVDYVNLLLNGASVNTALLDAEIPVLGSVDLEV